MRTRRKKLTCSICPEPVKSIGLCNTCGSWWYRTRLLTGNQLGLYLARGEFRAKRMLNRFASIDTLPKRGRRTA